MKVYKRKKKPSPHETMIASVLYAHKACITNKREGDIKTEDI